MLVLAVELSVSMAKLKVVDVYVNLLLLFLWRVPGALADNELQTDSEQILQRLTQCNVNFPAPG